MLIQDMFRPSFGRIAGLFLGLILFVSACGRSREGGDDGDAPIITTQPSTVFVEVGGTGSFGVIATGTEPFAYQWFRDGDSLPGATAATLVTAEVTVGDSGARYWVKVRNESGQTASDTAQLHAYAKGDFLGPLRNFAETAARNWNHGGHVVDDRFDGNQGRWELTDDTYEPWLFDRPEVWRMLAEMTGDAKWTVQANADLAYYEARLGVDGIFTNKGEDDTKYSYVHSWSGNAAKQAAAYDATVDGFPDEANLSPGALWTERELWVGLYAAVHYHTVSGDTMALHRAQAMVDQWDEVAAGRGAPLVTYTLHEGGGPGGTTPTDLVTSPWMSALYFQAARLYAVKVPAAALQVYKQASDYFDWLNTPSNRGFYPGTDAHPQYAGLFFPAYLAGGTTIGDAAPDESNMAHALDVAGMIAFAIKAKVALGLPTAAAEERLEQMKVVALLAFADATRPTSYLPMYRLAPPRKFNWWVRGLYELRANDGE